MGWRLSRDRFEAIAALSPAYPPGCPEGGPLRMKCSARGRSRAVLGGGDVVAGCVGGLLVFPDRRFRLGSPTSVVPHIADDGLDDARRGDGQEGAEDPGKFDRDEDGQQDGQWVELDGARK